MRQSPTSNSSLVTWGSYQFPTYGLAVVLKNKFLPLEASPLVVGICFSPRLLNHGVGNWYEPLVTCGELLFLSLMAGRSWKEISRAFVSFSMDWVIPIFFHIHTSKSECIYQSLWKGMQFKKNVVRFFLSLK